MKSKRASPSSTITYVTTAPSYGPAQAPPQALKAAELTQAWPAPVPAPALPPPPPLPQPYVLPLPPPLRP